MYVRVYVCVRENICLVGGLLTINTYEYVRAFVRTCMRVCAFAPMCMCVSAYYKRT